MSGIEMAGAIAPPQRSTVIIRPTKGWAVLNLRELWQYRDVLVMLALRDIKLRYKHTALGVIWVVLQPLVAGLIFAVIFGKFAKLPSDGNPYLLFVFAGLIAWTFFAGAIQRAGNSLITDSRLITRVYFPRLLVPLSGTVSALLDFLVSLLLIAGLLIYYQVNPGWPLLLLPLFLLLTLILATGVSLWLSALNVQYRDFMYALPFLIQVWLFASPVAYTAGLVPEKWKLVYSLNPMVGIIEGFRFVFLGASSLTLEMLLISVFLAVAAFVSGTFFFRRVERSFADFL
jgi:lipopolysaccharide transport system permease protein